MAVYAIGDLQGCLDEFQRLLERLRFDPSADRLWLAGDLVNRGPKSLETLRFVHSLGEAALTVLGNHDLHLLALAAAERDGQPRSGDELEAILDAPDAAELVQWLRMRPVLHHDAALKTTLVHAGIPPQWNLDKARALAAEVETQLRETEWGWFMQRVYGNEPDRWSDRLTGLERLRFAVNGFVRMRFCTPRGRLRFGAKGPPGTQPDDQLPWFQVPGRKSRGQRIVFGHWSALGRIRWDRENVFGIDTGCVWGNSLTAMRVDGPPVFSQVRGIRRQPPD